MSIALQKSSHYVCTHTHTQTDTHTHIYVCMMFLSDQGDSVKKLFLPQQNQLIISKVHKVAQCDKNYFFVYSTFVIKLLAMPTNKRLG